MPWWFFAILAAICWSCCNLIDKVVVSKLIKQPLTVITMLGFVGGIAAGIIWINGGLGHFSLSQAALALVAGIAYAGMNIFYIKAVQIEEISKIIPLFSLGPVMIAVVAAIVLGEVFTLGTYIGIALVLVGAVTLSVQRLEKFRFNKAFFLMVGASAALTATEVIQKYLLRSHKYWSVFAYSRLGSLIVIIPLAWFYRAEIIEILRLRRLKTLGFMSVSEILNIAALLSIIYASSIGYVTLVNAVTQVQPFIVLLLTVLLSLLVPHILQEEQSIKIFARKFSSIAVMFIGILLLLNFQ